MLNRKQLEELGFEGARSVPSSIEYHALHSKELEEKLKESGYNKVSGFEGVIDGYAIFRADNEEHKDYGKLFISVLA